MKMTLNDSQIWTVINALRVAAEQYDKDFKEAAHDRTKEQFAKQRDEARDLADQLEAS